MTEQESKEELVVEYFLEHPTAFISDISSVIGISKSSIQRYLEKHKRRMIPSLNITIQEQLENNKNRGRKRGGIQSFINNTPMKDKQGRFAGTMKETSSNKDTIKQENILIIAKTFINHPGITLDELAEIFSPYTRDYIYDCLTSNRTKELIGEELFFRIKELLKRNHYSFSRKLKEMNLDDINIEDLTDQEKKIIYYRKKGLSQEEVGRLLNLSHTTIMMIENKIIEQIRNHEEKGHKK